MQPHFRNLIFYTLGIFSPAKVCTKESQLNLTFPNKNYSEQLTRSQSTNDWILLPPTDVSFFKHISDKFITYVAAFVQCGERWSTRLHPL